ncbi:WD40-repeat-containing domain protein [Mycena galericulata]|nr:WD40-repeat-containing domain protein [Mycena galericulata]
MEEESKAQQARFCLLTAKFVVGITWILAERANSGALKMKEYIQLWADQKRSLTRIKFNAKGDLLFSCSKDLVINVWYSHSGERLGTYDGNNGTVWTVDVDSESRFLVSGSADNTLRLWSVATGESLYTWEFPMAVKRVAFNEDDTKVVCITDKATVCAFTLMPNILITGHESGKVALFNVKTGEGDRKMSAHSEVVTDLQLSKDHTQNCPESDTKTLMAIKTYTTETPLNSAALVPTRPYVLLGGGQEAMNHKVYEEEVGRVKGLFGSINTISQVHGSSTGSEASFM